MWILFYGCALGEIVRVGRDLIASAIYEYMVKSTVILVVDLLEHRRDMALFWDVHNPDWFCKITVRLRY